MGVSHRRVSHVHVCWYMEYLAAHSYTPGAISNHVSHLRTFYRLSGLHAAPLHHLRVQLALRAVSMNIRRPSQVKLPVPPHVLKQVVQAVMATQDSHALVLALLIMFIGFARQSSVAPPTVCAFDPTRHLTRADAVPSDRGLAITIKWSKTLQKSSDLKTILLPPTDDPVLCPLAAYRRVVAAAPGAPPEAPLLAFKDGHPLTTRYIARRWHQALKDLASPPRLTPFTASERAGPLMHIMTAVRILTMSWPRARGALTPSAHTSSPRRAPPTQYTELSHHSDS